MKLTIKTISKQTDILLDSVPLTKCLGASINLKPGESPRVILTIAPDEIELDVEKLGPDQLTIARLKAASKLNAKPEPELDFS